jgi:hypothetical protein
MNHGRDMSSTSGLSMSVAHVCSGTSHAVPVAGMAEKPEGSMKWWLCGLAMSSGPTSRAVTSLQR